MIFALLLRRFPRAQAVVGQQWRGHSSYGRREIVVEYAKSERSRCKLRSCGNLIEKGSIRIGEKTEFLDPRSHQMIQSNLFFHKNCFKNRQLQKPMKAVFHPLLSDHDVISTALDLKSSMKKVDIEFEYSEDKQLDNFYREEVEFIIGQCDDEIASLLEEIRRRRRGPLVRGIGINRRKGKAKEKEKEAKKQEKGKKPASSLADPDPIPDLVEARDFLAGCEEISETMLQELFPFQVQGIAFAVKKERVLIADEMGLGKTVQAIGFALAFKREWPLLVICPSSLKHVWERELLRWVPNLKPDDINMISSGKQPGNVMAPVTIVPYSLLRKNSSISKILFESSFKVAILDESHYIKNARSARTLETRKVIQKTQRLALLTGTPAFAMPLELWPQISLLRPDIFPKRTEFVKRFCAPRKTEYGWRLDGANNLPDLNSLLKHLMVRRLKKDVMKDLPSKTRQKVPLDVIKGTSEETENITSLLEKCEGQQDLVEFFEQNKPDDEFQKLLESAFRETGALKVGPVADYVQVVLDGFDGKVIVFAHHISVLDSLENSLKSSNTGYMRIDGRTSSSQREEYVARFQDQHSGVRVALLGVTSAGVGITLTAATQVIFAELFYTPAVIQQAEDRAHRIGQGEPVTVHYLFAQGTADNILWELLTKKLSIVTKILDLSTPDNQTYLASNETKQNKHTPR